MRKDSEAKQIKALRDLDEQREDEIKNLEQRATTLDAIQAGTQALLFDKLTRIHSAMIDRGGWCPDG